MLYFGTEEKQMLKHTAEVMADRVSEENGYEPGDEVVVTKIDNMGRTKTSVLVITGEDYSHQDAAALFHDIVQTELKNWVPDASQRLLHRAGHALGVRHPVLLSNEPDCGAEPGWHALVADWIAGIYVRRCVTCCRIYRDGTPE